jgi:hypothetical protein
MKQTASALLALALLGLPGLTASASAEGTTAGTAAVQTAVPTPSRSVTIGIRQANGVYTFTGAVTPLARGLQVTLARLDGTTKRVTGVASTRTDAGGRYTIRTTLPAGMAGFYALTAAAPDATAGRSRLYGLVVPGRSTTPVVTETVSQRNARLKAASYLELIAFSRSGLIEQLEFEGFSNADATYGTDAQKANWMTQAARKARSYLDTMPFSRAGLITQLEFEGFTSAEAAYGVSQVGL